MLAFQIKRTGASTFSDYSDYVDSDAEAIAKKTFELNALQVLEISLHEAAGFVAPERHNEVRLTCGGVSPSAVFVGFITNDPSKEFAGVDSSGANRYVYRLTCSSEEIIAELASPCHFPSLPPFQNFYAGEILKNLLALLAPGRFNTSGIDDGDLIGYFAVEPDETFTSVVQRLADRSGYKFWTADGHAYFKPWVEDYSLGFDGTDDYVKLGEVDNWGITNQITLSAWANTNTKTLPNNHRMIMALLAPSYLSVNLSGQARPFLSLSITGTQRALDSNFVPEVDTWYHVAGTYDGDKLRIYVNGVLKNTSASYPGNLTALNPATRFIGRYTDGSCKWSGLLDGVRVYNRALSGSEIALLAAGSEPSATGLVGHWPFTEGTGTSTDDSSGSANTGTLYGDPTWERDMAPVLRLLPDASETDGDWNPENLTVEPQGQPIYNDVVGLGDVEPQAYVREYFVGDGLSMTFPLARTVYGATRNKLLQDDFSDSSLDDSLWTETDPGSHITEGASLFVDGGSGLNNTKLVAKSGLEMAGTLTVQAGVVRFTAPSSGIIGGLYSSPTGHTLATCEFGFKVVPSGGQSLISPIVDGAVPSGATTLLTQAGKDYIFLLAPQIIYRRVMFQRYYSLRTPSGFGGGPITSSAWIAFLVLTLDENDPSLPPIRTQLYSAEKESLSPVLTFVPINSDDLHIAVNYCLLTRPIDALLLTGPAYTAPLNTELLGYEREFDKDATIRAQGGDNALVFFGDIAPVISRRIELRYRSAGVARARVRSQSSITDEIARAGDSGIRAGVLPDLNPAPRNAAELERAIQAYIDDHSEAIYEGTFTFDTLKKTVSREPIPGRFFTVAATGMYPSFTAFAKSVESEILGESRDGSAEYIRYRVGFGQLSRFAEAARNLNRILSPGSVLQGERDATPPAVIEFEDVGTSFATDLPNARFVYTFSATGFNLDAGFSPPSGGFIEVRSWDALWGTAASANLVEISSNRTFTVPRSSRRQSLYLKYVNPSGSVSRYPALVQVNYPLVPSLPSAILDSSDRLFPEVSLFLPADPTDVFGVEIRDTDASTVLYQYGDLTLAISPDDPALIWVWDNSASKIRTKTLYAYCWNVLGEYSTARQVDISMPAPAVSGLTFDETDQSLRWAATSGVSYYELQVSPSAGFSPVTASGNFDGTSFGLTLKDVLQERWYRVRGTDVLGVGDWTSDSHSYTTVGPSSWDNTNNVISIPPPSSPYSAPPIPPAFGEYKGVAYQLAMQDYTDAMLSYAQAGPRPITKTIAVGNLVTTEKYAASFEVECWNSTRTVKIDGPRAVSAVYDATSATWKQKSLVSFAGLTTGTVYSFRARVTTQSEGPVSAWTAWVDETAGDTTAPSSTYTPTWTAIANGTICGVAVSGAASDLDRYEWYWSVASGTPASGTPGNAPNTLSGATVEQTFQGTSGQTVYAWIRAVDTSGNRQAWQSLTNRAVGNVDDAGDGTGSPLAGGRRGYTGLNASGDVNRDIPGAIKVVGRSEGLSTTLVSLNASGKLLTADDIAADGTGSPLAGGRRGYAALTSANKIYPGAFADSNPGLVTSQVQIADGTIDDDSGYWVPVATVDFQVPGNCANMQFTLTPTLGGGTSGTVVLYTAGDNIGIAIYTGTTPNDPTVSRYGAGSVTYTNPSGTKLTVYLKGKPGTRDYIEGKCSQDLVTPLRSGYVL